MVRTIIQIEDSIYSEQIKTWKLNSQNGNLTIHMVLNDKTKIVKKLDYCKVYPFEQLTLSEDEVFELNGEISKNIDMRLFLSGVVSKDIFIKKMRLRK
ncbi:MULTISPECIES: hypothetical protein [Bacillus]|uniref:hypothetical protein n=1 Tax=Bacillus TaxID=1386 RepID=UPI0006A84082|nr:MULTISPECIES: hypothetical protein [Bacillus]MDY7905850.1 hypothetical protein [Bacillus sp. AG1]CUB43725.1 hypothetical protein BN2127_JRS8_02626 [Bacillus amyloliquefaciens]